MARKRHSFNVSRCAFFLSRTRVGVLLACDYFSVSVPCTSFPLFFPLPSAFFFRRFSRCCRMCVCICVRAREKREMVSFSTTRPKYFAV